MRQSRLFAMLVALLLAALSAAQTHYISQGNRLYRYRPGGSLTSIGLTFNGRLVDGFSALAFDPAGALWGQANGVIYKIDVRTGVLQRQWAFAPGNGSNSFDFRINKGVVEWVGVVYQGRTKSNAMVRKVAATGKHLGDYPVSGPPGSYAASAYDATSDRLYYALGKQLRYFYPETPSREGTLVGEGPLGKATQAGAAAFGGKFYLAFRNVKNGPLFFAHWDSPSRRFVLDFTLEQGEFPYQDGLGYAIAEN